MKWTSRPAERSVFYAGELIVDPVPGLIVHGTCLRQTEPALRGDNRGSGGAAINAVYGGGRDLGNIAG